MERAREDTPASRVGRWLDALASAEPAPGGGAAAAASVAIGASLVCMVCRITVGEGGREVPSAQLDAALRSAEEARRVALQLADEDAAAFSRVIAARRLPRATEEEASTRAASIGAALRGAADVPLRTAALAGRVIDLAGAVAGAARTSVAPDLAAAVLVARAALEASVLNVQVNLASMAKPEDRDAIRAALDLQLPSAIKAEAVLRTIRERIEA